MVGAEGVLYGVTADDSVEAGDAPPPLTDFMMTEYDVPFVNPVITNDPFVA
jgi:hypothetical protein